MPSPKHVDQNDKGRRAEYGSRGEKAREAAASVWGQGRRGIVLDHHDQAGSYLSPTRLLSNMGISNIRDYLPSSPQPSGSKGAAGAMVEGASGSWEEADLKDGQGRRPLLVLSSPFHALQIFALSPSTIPSDPNVQEVHPAPEEIVSIPNIIYSSKAIRTSLGGEGRGMRDGGERVICAKLMDHGDIRSEHGTVAVLLVAEDWASVGSAPSTQLALLVLGLRSGKVVRRVHVGPSSSGSLAVSSRAIVIAISQLTPSLHILSPSNLEPLHSTITELSVDPRTHLPTFTLSGRLVAYATSEAPVHPGPDRLGSIVTSKSLSSRSPSFVPKQPAPMQTSTSGQNVLNSAVGIGGGVARGVWAGIKMGAQAASRATNGRLATSAPAHGSLGIASLDTQVGEEESESRSLDDTSSLLDDTVGAGPSLGNDLGQTRRGGEWIKVIDIGTAESRTIAHFRLPRARPHTSLETRSRQRSDAGHSESVSYLAFSPDGTRLFVAPSDGRSFHLLDIRPSSPAGPAGPKVQGEVWHTYELRRGNSSAAVSEVKWSDDGRWVGVATGRGTVHVFAVNPTGGPPTSYGHVPATLQNPRTMSSLSTVVTPSARLRMRISPESAESYTTSVATTFTFVKQRQHPLKAETSCLDIAIYRSTSQVEFARLMVSYPIQPSVTGSPERQMTRRASALTEMMKTRVGMGSGDFDVGSSVKVTWAMPTGGGVQLLSPGLSDGVGQRTKRSLAFAEIQTFSANPHLLPASIYLSHQVDFYDARPIDEYSRLSIMDREARTRRLHFRPEVEIRSATPESGPNSFNEPLTSAIHSVIESSPTHELPQLPNGHGRNGFNYVHGLSLKSSIPIAQVKQGVGHLRREYARRSSIKSREAVSVSFEEDAVFAHSHSEEDGDSPMSSASGSGSGVPVTDHEGNADDEWGVRWEDEYSRAVEEEGGPDDLVLGLMDEQQEERKRWVERQKKLAREYAK